TRRRGLFCPPRPCPAAPLASLALGQLIVTNRGAPRRGSRSCRRRPVVPLAWLRRSPAHLVGFEHRAVGAAVLVGLGSVDRDRAAEADPEAAGHLLLEAQVGGELPGEADRSEGAEHRRGSTAEDLDRLTGGRGAIEPGEQRTGHPALLAARA